MAWPFCLTPSCAWMGPGLPAGASPAAAAVAHSTVSVGRLLLCSYQLTSGYKPAPMDLTFIRLTQAQEAMVDKLAENAHNVWARDRIRQGWTYGIQQVRGDFVWPAG